MKTVGFYYEYRVVGCLYYPYYMASRKNFLALSNSRNMSIVWSIPFCAFTYPKKLLHYKSLVWVFVSKHTNLQTYIIACLLNKVTRKLVCKYRLQDVFSKDTNIDTLAIMQVHWWP